MAKDNKTAVQSAGTRQAMLTGFISLAKSIQFFAGQDLVPKLLPEDYLELDEAKQQAAMRKATAEAAKTGEERKAAHNAKVAALAKQGRVFTCGVTVLDATGQPVELRGVVDWNAKGTGLRACISLPISVSVEQTEGKVKAQQRGGFIAL